MNTAAKQYRQGDILFIEVQELPKGIKKLEHCVIAEGEATGHKHQIVEEGAAALFELTNENGAVKFLQTMKDTLVMHEEHRPIPLKAGFYEIRQQREYQPKSVRFVAD
jgi:hypothetical protein